MAGSMSKGWIAGVLLVVGMVVAAASGSGPAASAAGTPLGVDPATASSIEVPAELLLPGEPQPMDTCDPGQCYQYCWDRGYCEGECLTPTSCRCRFPQSRLCP